MPRYRFHLYDHTGFVEDMEGLDLPSLDRARQTALKGARSIISQDVETGFVDLSGRIEVVDDHAQLVLVLPFGDAVKLRQGSQRA